MFLRDTGMSRAPNVVHFIYPHTERTRPWSVINTLAVRLAMKHHDGPIKIWTNDPSKIPLPENHEQTARILIVQVDLPTHLDGVEIYWPQYIADVMRLQILHEEGGIYMDTDMLLLKPLHEYLTDKLVLSWEVASRESISNALMISPAKNAFIAEWLRRMPEALQSYTWATGGVILPEQLSNLPELEPTRTILPHTFCCPLDLSQPWLFDPKLKGPAKERVFGSTAIHVFETYWRDYIARINLSDDHLLRELLEPFNNVSCETLLMYSSV